MRLLHLCTMRSDHVIIIALLVAIGLSLVGYKYAAGGVAIGGALAALASIAAGGWRAPGTTSPLPPSRVFEVVDVVRRLPTPQEVKGLTHVLEWDPDDFWALQVTAGDGRWRHVLSGARASMERNLAIQEGLLASQLANFRAEQRILPEGGEAWQRWEGRIAHLGKAEHRLVPDRRWRRHSLGVEAALEQIKQRLRMPSDKLRIRPLEEVEKEELERAE